MRIKRTADSRGVPLSKDYAGIIFGDSNHPQKHTNVNNTCAYRRKFSSESLIPESSILDPTVPQDSHR